MTTQFEKLPDEPIMIVTIVNYDFEIDGMAALERLVKMLDEQSEPVFYIANLLEALMNFDDFLKGANAAARQIRVFQHPKMREALLVTQESLVRLGAKGMESPVFGQAKFKIFETLDAALNYARTAAQQQRLSSGKRMPIEDSSRS